jgi:hypothetical protein
MDDVVKVAMEIKSAIRAIKTENQPGKYEALIKAKAEAMAEYDKQLAIEILRLKDQKVPISIIRDVAKGNISEYLYRKTVAEEALKALFSRLENLRAQLNGLQSVNRHLSEL